MELKFSGGCKALAVSFVGNNPEHVTLKLKCTTVC